VEVAGPQRLPDCGLKLSVSDNCLNGQQMLCLLWQLADRKDLSLFGLLLHPCGLPSTLYALLTRQDLVDASLLHCFTAAE
jgi:hypothetical protein